MRAPNRWRIVAAALANCKRQHLAFCFWIPLQGQRAFGNGCYFVCVYRTGDDRDDDGKWQENHRSLRRQRKTNRGSPTTRSGDVCWYGRLQRDDGNGLERLADGDVWGPLHREAPGTERDEDDHRDAALHLALLRWEMPLRPHPNPEPGLTYNIVQKHGMCQGARGAGGCRHAHAAAISRVVAPLGRRVGIDGLDGGAKRARQLAVSAASLALRSGSGARGA